MSTRHYIHGVTSTGIANIPTFELEENDKYIHHVKSPIVAYKDKIMFVFSESAVLSHMLNQMLFFVYAMKGQARADGHS